jgi:selenide, water dikinase
VLRRLPPMSEERLLTPTNKVEDAAAYLLDADRAILFTADYFTPVVDDPYTYGQIAAANAFSDIYAMGGRPKLALNLMNFPTRKHRTLEMEQILQGGANKALEAGCLIVGGHTIDDNEPKYGMAVVGEVHPDRLIYKGTSNPGDLLYLTKPLGSGILVTAFKNDAIDAGRLQPVVDSMAALNAAASEAALQAGVSAGTDVTGFGLLGHLYEMCLGAELSAVLDEAALPYFEGVASLAERGYIPAGSKANWELVAEHTRCPSNWTEHFKFMAADAQTSGGLLLAVPPNRASQLENAFNDRKQWYARIGVMAEPPIGILIR